jgi:CBS domain-containing protein
MTTEHLALQPYQGSYLTPAYEAAAVVDAMHPGVLRCAPDATLADGARLLCMNHVHCAVLPGPGGTWGLISALDLVRAATAGAGDPPAAEMARPPLTVHVDDDLDGAARLMADHGVEHLLVLARSDAERPVGVLSSLDVAGTLAWGRA